MAEGSVQLEWNDDKAIIMKLESNKVTVQKPAEELFQFLSSVSNYEAIMPDEVSTFKAYEDEFKFGLKSLPEVKLRIDETVPNERIVLKSAGGKIDFQLIGTISDNGDGSSDVQMNFEGEFNAMMAMMVKKPLNQFINDLVAKIEKI